MGLREHVNADVLLDYAEARLNATASAQVKSHLDSGCPECNQEFALWNRLVPRLRSMERDSTPDFVLNRAFALINSIEKTPSIVERIIAALVFDSRRQFAPIGIRDSQQPSVHLVYETPDARIDLLCERETARWTITGQVLTQNTSDSSWTVRVAGAGTDRVVTADGFGEFRLLDLEQGNYTVSLTDRERQIELNGFTL